MTKEQVQTLSDMQAALLQARAHGYSATAAVFEELLRTTIEVPVHVQAQTLHIGKTPIAP